MDFFIGQATVYLKIGVVAAVVIGTIAMIVRMVEKRGAEKDGGG